MPAVDVPAVGADQVLVHERVERRVVPLRGRRMLAGADGLGVGVVVVVIEFVVVDVVRVQVAEVQVVEVVHGALTQGLETAAGAAASRLWTLFSESRALVRV